MKEPKEYLTLGMFKIYYLTSFYRSACLWVTSLNKHELAMMSGLQRNLSDLFLHSFMHVYIPFEAYLDSTVLRTSVDL